MTLRTDPTRKGAAALTRRLFMIGGAGAAVAAVASCDAFERLTPTPPVRLESGVRGVVARSRITSLPDATAVPVDLAHAIEAPGARCRLVTVQKLSVIPVHALGVLGLDQPEDLEADVEEVAPAEGEIFLRAELVAEAPSLMPEATGRAQMLQHLTLEVLVGGTTVERIPVTDLAGVDAAMHPLSLLLSVPEDAGAEDVVLELVWEGVTQRLSLLDGARLPSEVDVLYTEPLAAEVEDNWWEREDDRFPEEPATAGYVGPVVLEPVAPDWSWAEPGTAFLGVRAQLFTTAGRREEAVETVLLADGTSIEPWGDGPPSGRDLAEEPTWFQVPREAGALTVRMRLAAAIGQEEVVDLGTEDVAVTISEVNA